MSRAFSPGLQVHSSYLVQKSRELPIRGEILVQQGQRVEGDQIVARAKVDGELRIVRVSDELGIAPAELAQSLTVAQGDTVQQGAVLAEMRGLWGLFRSTVSAPISGTIEFISLSTGHIGLRAAAQPLNLTAYIAGTVSAIEAERAVVIETQATFVQGIFGVGGERLGIIHLMAVKEDGIVDVQHVPNDTQGLILVGGCSPTLAALTKAAAGGAVGFITGSIDGATLSAYLGYDIGIALTGDEDISMTVIVTEGFGSVAISRRVLDALRQVDGMSASINGATQVRAGAQRPEIIAPAASVAQHDRCAASNGLVVGARVRLIRVPYFGAIGTVEQLPHELEQIESGAMARVLRARLEGGAIVTVPRANVELL